jgi:hypothetical protein
MNHSGLRGFVLMAAVTLGPQYFLPGGAPARDQEVFNQAKVLMFEQKWDGARQVFQRLIRDFPQSGLAPQAYYYSAYCLQLQKKPEEALLAYEQFLQKYPNEPGYASQARQTIVQTSASLLEQGKTAYRERLVTALKDPRKEVRYIAAIRGSSLRDRELDPLCIPVLKEIVAKEKQQDLVAPASIALLRLDPAALARPASKSPAGKGNPKQDTAGVKMLHLQIFENGDQKAPTVELNFPVSFAQIAILALDEPTKAELRKKGFDIENIWEGLNRLSPTNILTVRNGLRVVKLWIQ